ncbi:MAG: S-methyl-5-thioribose-1-phosphate isomerase [Hyphomicrobiales bacterium]
MARNGKPQRPIWLSEDGRKVIVIDQRRLPDEHILMELATVDDAIHAIKAMAVRGAPLIGVTGAYGMLLAALAAPAGPQGTEHLKQEASRLAAARPTAVNLAWAVERVLKATSSSFDLRERIQLAHEATSAVVAEEVENCRRIGLHGLPILEALARGKGGKTVNILTHCNAGWLACVEHGTATAPIYAAFDRGIDLHVWVDETRPLNQGSRLTAWELAGYGVKHTVITDNAGGHLMQRGEVDLVIVGTDRTTAEGDVANKIGTYLKALAARDNNIPFYVALPSSTFDWSLREGAAGIPIEEREPDEVRWVAGWDGRGQVRVRVCPEASPVANFAFDVTPARLITGLITERGICRATAEDIRRLFSDKVR